MARIRTIKPIMWASEKLGKLSILARLTFVGMISLADDAGRGRGAIPFLRGNIHPYAPDVTDESLGMAVVELHKSGILVFYEVLGCRYYAIMGWQHQKIDHPSPSEIPPPPASEPELFGEHSRTIREDSRTIREEPLLDRKGREGIGEEGRTALAPSPDESGPALMMFPCVGAKKIWNLTQSFVDMIRVDFPNLDVLAEIKKSHAWVVANPGKRKTHRGMPAFLVRWMTRVTDRGGSRGSFGRPPAAVGAAAHVAGKFSGLGANRD